MYGITETTVHVTYRAARAAPTANAPRQPDRTPDPRPAASTSWTAHGQPVPVGVHRRDVRRRRRRGARLPEPPGTDGGALHRRSVQRPPGARLYKTGDLARWLANGEIEYLGRNDYQVKIRGFRIELGEIEATLGACAGVREAVVIAREDQPGEKRLVAYLVADGEAPSAADLRGALSASLADYMIPSAFVTLDAFPLTANGKLDRQALPAPGATSFARPAYRAPSGHNEEALCHAWCEVLQLERVGVDDNYFEVGGDSIRSIAIVAKAREHGLTLAIVDIFKHPTVARLAAAIEARGDIAPVPASATGDILCEADRAALPAYVEDAYPVTMLQLGMLFHNQFEQDDGLYHDVFSNCLGGMVWRPDALRGALDALCRKHPILRTTFNLGDYSEALQLVHAHALVPLTVTDISELDTDAQDALIARFVDDERKTRFDFDTPPLLRVFIHVRGRDTIQYTVSFHHAILDGWSVASLQTELFNTYRALLDSGAAMLDLAPLSLTPQYTAARERQALRSEQHKEFWRRYLADYAFSALPPAETDSDFTGLQRRRGAAIAPEVCAGLQRLAQALSVPIRTILLSAQMRVVAMLTGCDDVTVGLVSNVRPEQADGEKVLGLFLNTLPFRQQVGAGRWTDLIAETYRSELDVIAHRHYPYFQLHLDNGRQPYYEIMFNFVNFHVYEEMGADPREADRSQTFAATGQGMLLNCSYSATAGVRVDLIARDLSMSQVERFLGYYLAVLDVMAGAPESEHRSHQFLSPAERAQLLLDFNDTAVPCPQGRLIHQLFEEQAALRPQRRPWCSASRV